MAFNLASESIFVIKLLTSGILHSISVILALKFVFVTKLLILRILISISVTLELKFVFFTRLLTSGILFSTSVSLVLKSVFFFTKPLTSGVLFSAAVNAELVARPVILGISPYISKTLELKSVFFNQITNIWNFFLYLIDFILKI